MNIFFLIKLLLLRLENKQTICKLRTGAGAASKSALVYKPVSGSATLLSGL